jgi:hypothetical protein
VCIDPGRIIALFVEVIEQGLYQIVVKGYINNFLVAGDILFGFGLIFFILAYNKILNLKN